MSKRDYALLCTAIVVAASRKYTQRCRHQKTPGSDYCGHHIAAIRRGEVVRQVRGAEVQAR